MESRAAATADNQSPESRPRDLKVVSGHAGRYLEVLGVGPNASFDEINTAYFTYIKRFPENPTEEDEAHLQEVKRAYDMLRRGYQPKVAKAIRFDIDKRVMAPMMAAVLLMMLGGLIAFNWKAIRVRMIHYDTGTVLSLKGQTAPYGQVVGYETSHHFASGNPSAAYELRLQETGRNVWVSERLVVNGMAPIAGK